MASTSTALSVSASSIIDSKTLRHSTISPSPQCVNLPSLAPPQVMQSHNRWHASKATSYCRKLARSVVALATGDVPAAEVETPEIVKTIIDTWDKVEDKYAVTSLAVAGVVAVWGSSGMISAIDRLPVLPGVLELVGIGYTGWFAYQNLIFKPQREVFLQKIKDTYKDVLGSSSS